MAEAKKENFFARTGKRISRWFREMKSELKKVVWPTRSQMINNTLIVLACVLVVGICIWVFDAVGTLVVDGILSLPSLIGG
jgi:preprotein translocase subunit SecE